MVTFQSVCVYWEWPGFLRKIQPYVVVACCFLVNLTIGSMYAVGNLIPYVVSYIRVDSHPHDLRLNIVTYIYASQAVGVGMAMILGGLLDSYIGPRLVVLIGGTVMTVGSLLSYVTIQYSFWWFMFTYGLITGIGLGIVYISPIICSIKWLPKWKGLVSGVALAGIAMGTLMYSLIQTGFINPNNEKPSKHHNGNEKYFTQPEVLSNVPIFFLILGISYAFITLITSIFLVNPRNDECDESISKLSSSESERLVLDCHPKTVDSGSLSPTFDSLTPLQALKTRNFYILTFLLTIGHTVSSFINSLCKSFGLQEVDRNDHFLTLVVSIGAFFNLLGRILWPLLADLTSYKTSIVIQGSYLSVFLMTFYATVFGGKFMYAIWVCCTLFGIGGYVSLFPSAAVKSFGPKNMSIIYGMIASFGLTVGSSVAGGLSQVMVNIIEWYGTFFVLGGLSCIYLIVILLYNHRSYANVQ